MMTSKRAVVLTLVATALVALSCTYAAADAVTGESEDYTFDYKYNLKTLTATVIDYTGTASEIVIPQTVVYNGDVYSVTEIAKLVFYECNFTKVTLPEGLKVIGDGAFKYIGQKGSDSEPGIACEVTIPSSVTKIGANAFIGFVGQVTFEDGSDIESIGYRAFYDGNYGAAKVSNVNYSAEASIDESNFVAKNGLIGAGDPFTYEYDAVALTATVTGYTESATEIAIPQSVVHDGETYTVTAIGKLAFYECNFTKVTLPEGLEIIEDAAFKYVGQKKLTGYTEVRCEVTIPSSVTTIGDNAFIGFVGQVSFADGSSIGNIGYRAFYNGNYGAGSVENLNFAVVPSIDESNFDTKRGLIGATEYQACVDILSTDEVVVTEEAAPITEMATGSGAMMPVEPTIVKEETPAVETKEETPAVETKEETAPVAEMATGSGAMVPVEPTIVEEKTPVVEGKKAILVEKTMKPTAVKEEIQVDKTPQSIESNPIIVPLVEKKTILVETKKDTPAETPVKTSDKKEDVAIKEIATGSSLDGVDISGPMKIISTILLLVGGLYVVRRQML